MSCAPLNEELELLRKKYQELEHKYKITDNLYRQFREMWADEFWGRRDRDYAKAREVFS